MSSLLLNLKKILLFDLFCLNSFLISCREFDKNFEMYNFKELMPRGH